MKITGFIFDLSKGGAQGVFVTVINDFCKRGYKVEVVTQNLNDQVHLSDFEKGIKIVSLNVTNAKQSLRAILSYLKDNKVECALVFGPELCVNLYFAKILCGQHFKIIGRSINTLSVEFRHTNSIFRKYITHAMIKLFFHKIDYVIAQSNNMAEDLIKHYYFRNNQVRVINNALSKIYEEELNNTSVSERGNYFLYVGRLEKQKGLHMLLDAFATLQNNDVKLIFAGDGSEKQALINYADTLGIQENVEFVGYTSKPLDYYRNASAVVLSSYFEGFPNVLIESIACGTPVVSFDCPSGPDEIIIDGVNGYLVEYCNVSRLAESMNNALYDKWDSKKIKETSERYKSTIILSKYNNLLRECIANLEE